MAATTLTLIVYDVTKDRQRTRLSRMLDSFAVRVQKSAYEGRLTAAERREIVRLSTPLIDPETDRLSLYAIGKAAEARIVSLGAKRPSVDAREWWVV